MRGELRMPIESHIDSLKDRHQELEQKLQEMQASLGTSESEISDLKRKKLQIKDRIEQLKASKVN